MQAVVSTPLLNILQENGFGLPNKLPLSRIQLRFIGFAFIDDTDLVQMLNSASNAEDVC